MGMLPPLVRNRQDSLVTSCLNGAPSSLQLGSSSVSDRGSITAPLKMCAPSSAAFSSTTTRKSGLLAAIACCRNRIAAARPEGPPPMITTSAASDSLSICSGASERDANADLLSNILPCLMGGTIEQAASLPSVPKHLPNIMMISPTKIPVSRMRSNQPTVSVLFFDILCAQNWTLPESTRVNKISELKCGESHPFAALLFFFFFLGSEVDCEAEIKVGRDVTSWRKDDQDEGGGEGRGGQDQDSACASSSFGAFDR